MRVAWLAVATAVTAGAWVIAETTERWSPPKPTHPHRLEFKIVADGQPVMERMAEWVTQHPQRSVRVEPDSWSAESDEDIVHNDYYLTADERSTLETVARFAGSERLQAKGQELAFEHRPSRDKTAGNWRTYLLWSRVELDGSSVARAELYRDSTTNRAEVLATFTPDGAARFAQLTGANVGRKLAIILDGTIVSAPVIQGAIRGGRTTITMGGGPPEQIEAEARALVDSLNAKATELQHRLTLSTTTRWLLGAAAALLLLGGALVVGRLLRVEPAPRPLPEPAPGGRWPWARLLVTVLAPAAVHLGTYVRLPGLDLDEVSASLPRGDLSVFSLGLSPVILAFAIVELAALAVPRWRPLRVTGRASLDSAALAVGVLVGVVFSYRYLASFTSRGPVWTLVLVASMVAGMMCMVVLAALVNRYGLGNGYAVVIASWSLVGVRADLATTPAIPATAFVVFLTAWALARKAGPRIPACGVVPAWLLTMSWALLGSSFLGALSFLGTEVGALVLLGVLAAVLSLLFGSSPSRPVATAVLGAGFVLLVDGIGRVTWLPVGPVAVCLLTAAAIDIAADWRARARADLVEVASVHRPAAADDAVATLAAHGITPHLRNLSYRTLLQLVGPFAPIGVMVPRDRAEEARAVLSTTS